VRMSLIPATIQRMESAYRKQPISTRTISARILAVATLAITGAVGTVTPARPLAAATHNSKPKPPKTTAPTTQAPAPTIVAAKPNEAETLRVALSFPPRAGLSVYSDDAFLLSRLGVTETLVRANSSGDAEPLLATSWEQITGTTWRFSLRKGVSFHDGTPLDAVAVVNAITKSATSATPPRALRGVGLGLSVVDSTTVEVTTTRPDPLVPLRLSSPGSAILSAAAYKTAVPSPIGTATGIYVIDKYTPDQRIELRANTKHWKLAPSIPKVEARLIGDASARAAALRAGEIDLAEGIPPSQLDAVRKDSNLRPLIFDLPRTTSIYLNTSRAPFNSVDARRAIDNAVDRFALASSLLEGAALPAAGYFGPAVAWDSDVTPPKQNTAEARRLAEKVGLPKKIRLWTYPARAELPELAVAIKEMLGRAGIDVEVTVAEYGTLEPDVLGGRYDMFLLSRSYMVDVPDPAAFLTSDFTCNGSYNLNRFCDTRVDAELAALAGQTTKSARERGFAAAARNLDLDVVGVPILHDRARIAHNRKLTGLVADPLEQRLLTSELRLAP
jgi:peptide/nickel transport system substrate-binding protein